MAADGGADMSWLVRYTMPAVLLGGLVLGGVNNCGNRAEQRIVADQRMRLQADLDAMISQQQEAQAKIFALQSDFDSATAQSARFASRAATLSDELGFANSRVTELENALSGEMSRQEVARAEVGKLAVEAAKQRAALAAAQTTIAALQSRLEDAQAAEDAARESRTRVAELRADLAASSDKATALQGLLMEVTAERDSFLRANKVNRGKLRTAISERDFARDKLARLESELSKAVDELARKDEQLRQLDVPGGQPGSSPIEK